MEPSYIKLKIKVLPPFWKSTLAYIIYSVLLITGILFLYAGGGIQKIRKQFADEKEKQKPNY
jgi:hypothetical protein